MTLSAYKAWEVRSAIFATTGLLHGWIFNTRRAELTRGMASATLASPLAKVTPAAALVALAVHHAGRQFRLFTNTAERELAFQQLKQQSGSQYMYHGSPFLKWHSIMRTCLQTFSNTEFMTNGAACGSGVYTASDVSPASI